jgi:hypothetical protein
VKKLRFARSMVAFTLFFGAVGSSTVIFGAEQAVDECSRELLLAYFPEPFVKETLKKFNVPENEWDAIQKALSSKDKEVVKLVEQKASEMDPNPLKDPQARQGAIKLFRETLLEVFSDVMKAHGIQDDHQIQKMLDDVQQQKAQRFAKCIQRQEEKSPVESKAPKQETQESN